MQWSLRDEALLHDWATQSLAHEVGETMQNESLSTTTAPLIAFTSFNVKAAPLAEVEFKSRADHARKRN